MINVGKGGGETGEVIPHALTGYSVTAKKIGGSCICICTLMPLPHSKGLCNPFENDPVSDWIDEDVFRRHRQRPDNIH
ncbi:MAG: hypothetical protein ACLU94_10930 [Catenibacillus sp.]